ncbi:LysE/ArgO family amino acid transporter [Legionella quinlivanii]|uniref:LysE/ArgO family amino acid transporter n=1 Tax=Legionella quinlivanii TaxID=45073 RepID=UPI0022441B52|nr:LysE family transporter [Legionella quinlivanii]MCW8452304.1 LysE family transporter [Legionella quinlivanii]
MPIYLNGLLLGLSLITALGPQNIFLIRQGAMRHHAVLSATICFFCDVILICASIAGLNHALELHPTLRIWVTWFGALFLFYYGLTSVRKALKTTPAARQEVSQVSNRLQILLLALGFSLLNPHAIIDSLVIIGGGSAQFPEHKLLFLCGVLSASFIWFSSLTFTTFYFSEVLSRAKVWRRIEFGSGVLMIFIGLKLVTS